MLVSVQDVAEKSFGYVIIGGGTAGLTLAARLSENPTVTVCVLEGGDSNINDPDLLKLEFGRTLGNPDYDWAMSITPQPTLGGRQLLWSRGKGLGGSSAINAMGWLKPPAAEIDDFERLGNPGWNWKNFQKYLAKTERYVPPPPMVSEKFKIGADSNDLGAQGALPISFPRIVGDSERYFTETLKNAGFNAAPHPFGGDPTGYFTPMWSHDFDTDTRAYSLTHYYLPCKDRKNLSVLVDALVARIVTEKTSDGSLLATGVEFIHNGKTHTVKVKKEAILAAGALQSPQILELSGIGRQDVLKKVGIDVKLELPGVGENMQEHCFGGFTFELKEGHRFLTYDMKANTDPNNMTVFEPTPGFFTLGMVKVAFLPVDQVTPKAQAIYEKAKAMVSDLEKRGAPAGLIAQYKIQLERLQPKQHQSGPGCEIFCLSGPAGPVPTEEGKAYMGVCWASNHPFSRGTVHVVSKDPAQPPEIDAHYFECDTDMDITLEMAKLARRIPLDFAPLKDVVEKETVPGPSVKTDEELREYLKKTFSTTWHSCGTCSMLPRDKNGVVDHKLKVHGTANIRIVDLSIAPLQIAAHTQSLVYAIAEQAADIIQGKI